MKPREAEFYIPFKARGKESVRSKGKSHYIPDKTRDFMNKVYNIFLQNNLETFKGPVMVEIRALFKRPGSVSPQAKWMDRKPDLDNIEKAIFDAASKAGLWEDDCQVAASLTKKMWSDSDCIYVTICTI